MPSPQYGYDTDENDPERDVVKKDEKKLLVEKKEDVENLEEKLENNDEVLDDVVKEKDDDVELDGVTQGDPVHWL